MHYSTHCHNAEETEDAEAHQLCSHTVCSLQGPLVQKVIIAPVPALLVLLVCMVHVEEGEVITCGSRQHEHLHRQVALLQHHQYSGGMRM